MNLIMGIAGLWALLAGRVTLSPSLRLRGGSARFFGIAVIAYLLTIHPLLIFWRLKWIPVSDEAAGGRVLYLGTELILMVAVAFALGKLALKLFPPATSEQKNTRTVSTGLWVSLAGIGLVGILMFSFHSRRAKNRTPATMSKPGTEKLPAYSTDITVLEPFIDASRKHIQATPTIQSNVGTPMTITPITQRGGMSTPGGTLMHFDVTGPKGKGTCEVMFIPASANSGQEGYILFWTFNGQRIRV